MNKATKFINLVLISSSLILSGCNKSVHTDEDEQAMMQASGGNPYPAWWWWYMHRPYFVTPTSGVHYVHVIGSGGTYTSVGSGSYSSARSVSGAKTGAGSVKSISARGGFSGGSASA